MSRIFDALKQSSSESHSPVIPVPNLTEVGSAPMPDVAADAIGLDGCAEFSIRLAPINRLVSLSDERGLGAEKLRVLATKLRHARQRRAFSKVLVTSSIKGEGKSVISANLAITLANQARQNTLLIDGDFRCPTQPSLLGVASTPGVSDWWQSDVPLNQIVRRNKELPLWFLSAGHVSGQPLDILQSQRFADLIARFNGFFHWIVVDSPPLTPLADSTVWGNMMDAVLMVVRQNVTPIKVLRSALETVERGKLLGVVVNESRYVEKSYYDQYYRGNAKNNAARTTKVAE